MTELTLHPDRLFPVNERTRAVARELYESVKQLPIISPHGHTEAAWFADNQPFGNAVELFIQPDHYVFRMLFSQGITLESLGIKGQQSVFVETDLRKIWQTFASHYHIYRGTPSKLWLDSVFHDVFHLDVALDARSADHYFDTINAALNLDSYRPRALFERFNIEVIATTESALDPLVDHQRLHDIGWGKKVITTYRPDALTDPDYENFAAHLAAFGDMTREDVTHWRGYLNAHKKRREFFKSLGATATDHSHPTAKTADLSKKECENLYQKIVSGIFSSDDAELFRAQMLTEMAVMSAEDGLVMQLHCGPKRNHNVPLFQRFGRDKGADVPTQNEYIYNLQPMLNKLGSEPGLKVIVFTLDESTYTRELAPLAGHYPALKIGPAWWFHDSPEGMRRYRQQITETAGFYNTVGFNDDTRAFFSIPARHDVARRMDCSFLAELVGDHRLTMSEAEALAYDLSYRLAKAAYNLD